MSVQIGCMICGEQSPETIETGPAIEWSNAHRCTTEKLIAMANERRTVTRLGKMLARETDRDLVIMRELAKRLTEVSEPPSEADLAVRGLEGLPASDPRVQARNGAVPEPQGEPSDAEVDAAARALNPEAWRAYDTPFVENPALLVAHSRAQARAALRAAGGVR